MTSRTMKDFALTTGGELAGNNISFSEISIDSRNPQAGAVFLAISGPNFDGHDFIAQAKSRGAVGLVVNQAMNSGLPEVVVSDTRRALGDFAEAWRRNFSCPVIGITGSSGKTTVKNTCGQIMSCIGETLATEGNHNNDIGLPLTLLRMRDSHNYAVIELGADKKGEIARLTEIARPDVGVVANVGPAHLAGFGSVQGVAETKGELFVGLPGSGTAVINADEPFYDYWRDIAGDRRIVTFGFVTNADFHVDRDAISQSGAVSRFDLQSPDGEIEIELPLPGMHNVNNALAAAAAAWAAGASLQSIQSGLKQARGATGRLQIIDTAAGMKIINDTYNANPLSLSAALQWLVSLGGTAWLVLGDMKELGEKSQAMHRKAGVEAKRLGVQRLYTFGDASKEAVSGFGMNAIHFQDMDQLNERLRKDITPGITVLVKGSRGMRMERVVEALTSAAEKRG